MSLDFHSPDRAVAAGGHEPVARSPIEPSLRRAGARFELRGGWSVATGFGDPAGEAHAARSTVAVSDRSVLGKLEVTAPLEPGTAIQDGGAWWCPLTRERTLVLCPTDATAELRERLADVVDLTSALAAVGLEGPRARDVLARLTALDVRPDSMPEAAFRPGSVARVPALLLHEDTDRFLLLFGSAHAQYMWEVVNDAAAPFGGRPAGAGRHA